MTEGYNRITRLIDNLTHLLILKLIDKSINLGIYLFGLGGGKKCQ